jgi:hypothetical protein
LSSWHTLPGLPSVGCHSNAAVPVLAALRSSMFRALPLCYLTFG